MKVVKLADVVQIQIGKTPRRNNNAYWGSGVDWVSISDMKTKEIKTTKEQITTLAIKESGCKLIPKGTLLLSFKLSIGKLGFAGKDLYTNEAIAALIIKDHSKLNKEFLYYQLKQIPFEGSNKAVMGSTLNKESLSNLKISVPENIEDQFHIANILSKAEKLIAQRKVSIRLLDELLKSTFLEMFGDFMKGEKVKLFEVASITSGLTKGKKYEGKVTRFVPYMRVANVQDGYLDLREIKEIEATEEEIIRFNLKEGDLLLTEGGDPDKLGRGTIWKNQIQNCIFQNHIFRVRVNENKIQPTFLSFLTASSYGKKYFLKSAKQTTGIASINSTQLKNFPAIVPPIALQTQFAQIVEKVELLKTQYKTSLTELENLYGSLSQKAFKGELDLRNAEFIKYEFFDDQQMEIKSHAKLASV